MDNRNKILIIEDEAAIRKMLEIVLQSSMFSTIIAVTAKEGKILAAMHQPDLVLLDLGLPDDDGQHLLKALREWYSKPILVLSARSDEAEIVEALDGGANDYLTKPFRTGELLARIRSALRLNNNDVVDPLKKFGSLSIDLSARIVKRNDEVIKLTTTEFALLSLF